MDAREALGKNYIIRLRLVSSTKPEEPIIDLASKVTF
jgi:hypothetical protein